MAEAVVEERAAIPTRFYCHMCNVEINIPNTDYICPLCSGGFVEALPERQTDRSRNNSGISLVTNASSNSDVTGAMPQLSDLETLRNDIASLLTSRNVPNLEITIEPGSRRANVVSLNGGNNTTSAGTSTSSSSTSNVGGGRVRPSNLDRLDNVLFDFLQSLPLATGGNGNGSNSHMFFMGHPGDYAWGREGLDTIVTQMLNQMETSGPPPLAKQKIDEISKVPVTKEEVDRKLQCSVCWDDFEFEELVRKLPCGHIYHENCIVPWLNLHGTCPICRKSLTDDEMDDVSVDETSNDAAMHISATERATHGSSTQTGDGTAAATINDARTNSFRNAYLEQVRLQRTEDNSQQPTQTIPNNVFTFDDGNMNLD